MPIDYCNILETHYGLTPKRLGNAPGGQLAECDDGKIYIIKQSRISPEKILCAHIATEHLNKNGLTEAAKIIPCQNGLPFATASGGFFTLTEKPTGRECVLESSEDLGVASMLLAKMHIAAKNFTLETAEDELKRYSDFFSSPTPQAASHTEASPPEDEAFDFDTTVDDNGFDNRQDNSPKLRFKCDLGKTPDVFSRRLSELKRFRKNAAKRRERFDYEYSAIAGYYCSLAEKVCNELSSSSYGNVVDKYRQEGCLCHREYTAHNILMDTADTASHATSILGFDSVCIEMPSYDLANFIRRRMRKCGWSVGDAEFIVKKYDSVKTVTPDEQQILRLLLQFPQKLWRIANKYYNSRRVWCEKSCLLKLEEVKQEKDPLAEFSKHFLV